MSDSASPSMENRLEILLVEDTLEEALLIRTLLEDRLPAKVTLAQDGIRGCQLTENQDWDLVITDLNIPGRDGMEVIRTSKAAFPRTPVLATTAYTGPHYEDQAVRLGADDVLTKPLELQELLDKVEALLHTAARKAGGSGERKRPERTILALGALPGDVELGCGGILLGHRAHGHAVVILVMSAGGDEDHMEERRREAETASRRLGAELVLADPFRGEIPPVESMIAWMREAVQEYQPDTLYSPSPNDVRDSRLRTHRAAVAEGSDVPNHYCYQAASTTLDFHPGLFINVGEYTMGKLELLQEYRGSPEFRPHLQQHIALATAQYWGRFVGYCDAEPLEVLRSEM